MRDLQLKESLLGWGGYKDFQEKIYLDKQVVYMRGNRSTASTTLEGPFFVWAYENGGNTTYLYTKSRYPKLGEIAFTSNGTKRIVENYDSDTGILICTNNANEYIYDSTDSSITFTVTQTTEKIYLINIDGTQNNKTFTLTIDYDDTVKNEKFFFDKQTQCLIRVAIEDIAGSSAWMGIGATLKKIVFDSFNPNTGIRLDHHIVYGYCSLFIDNSVDFNCSQGLYSFYCNGVKEPATASTTGIAHPAKIFAYSPRRRRVFEINVGSVVSIENPIPTYLDNYVLGYSADRHMGLYNETQATLDDLSNISCILYSPHYTGDFTQDREQKVYKLKIDLERNPAAVSLLDLPGYWTLNTSTDAIRKSHEKYPLLPFTTCSSLYAGNGIYTNMILHQERFNWVSDQDEQSTIYYYWINPSHEDRYGYTTSRIPQAGDIFYRDLEDLTDTGVVNSYDYGSDSISATYDGHTWNMRYDSSTEEYDTFSVTPMWKNIDFTENSSLQLYSLPDDNMVNGSYGMSKILYMTSNGWVGRIANIGAFSDFADQGWTTTYISYTGYPFSTAERTRLPRLMSGPKIVNTPTLIARSAVLTTVSSVTYTKTKADPCYALFIRYKAGNTYGAKLCIISKTADGCEYSTSSGTVVASNKIRYNNENYYYQLINLGTSSSSSGITIDNPTKINITNIPNISAYSDQTFVRVCLGNYSEHISYTPTTLVKDYYNEGQYTLVYKCINEYNDFSNITVYDSISGNSVTSILYEISIIPESDQHLVLVSTSDITTAARYITLIHSEYNSSNVGAIISEKIDCNRNTAYLADNVAYNDLGPNSVRDGGFAIPPVAIADGDVVGYLYTYSGDYSLTLPAGKYNLIIRGGGGAGGSNGATGTYGTGGNGGAGAIGSLTTTTLTLDEKTVLNLYVGPGGLTYANGGNGGAGGGAGSMGGAGGTGGGGGKPSYIRTPSTTYFANGGGGGGGAGGGASTVVFNAGTGAGGGGGGGYYYYDTTTNTIVAVNGQAGANGGQAGAGAAGVAGNQSFSQLSSGKGGDGVLINWGTLGGGAAASGGGASGGSGGGYGAYYEGGVTAGAGGGGAGGSPDAGGGECGHASWGGGTSGTNYHTTPTSGTDYQGNTVTSGWGIGGTTSQDGSDGFIYIERVIE